VNTQSSTKGTLAIVLASFLWGTTGTSAQFAPDISPLAIGAFAMGVGGILLCLSAMKALKNDAPRIQDQPLNFLLGSLCVAIYPLAFYSSMRLSGVAVGTVVSIASAPLFAAIFEYTLSKKSVSLQWFLSFILGACGIGLLALGKAPSEAIIDNESDNMIGVILGLIAGATYAGYSWSAKRFIDSGINSRSAMAGLFGGAALLLLPSLYFTGTHLFSSAVNTSVAVYMAVVPMFIGYLLFGYGLRTIHASKATLITLIEPLVATLFAIFLIGESFKSIGWIGMLLVCICLIIQSVKLPFFNRNKLPRKRTCHSESVS